MLMQPIQVHILTHLGYIRGRGTERGGHMLQCKNPERDATPSCIVFGQTLEALYSTNEYPRSGSNGGQNVDCGVKPKANQAKVVLDEQH